MAAGGVNFDLAALTEQIRLATMDLAGRDPDPALLAARLSDGAKRWQKPCNGAGVGFNL